MGKAENEAREKARRDKNVKKWKQNTDRWAKWKADKKANTVAQDTLGWISNQGKAVKEDKALDKGMAKWWKASHDTFEKMKKSKAKAGLQMANLTSKAKLQNLRNVPVKEETKFILPEKYGGDYSVRKIYKDDH